MANAFDRFYDTSGNPFDKFEEPTAPTKTPMRKSAQEWQDRASTSQLTPFLGNLGAGLLRGAGSIGATVRRVLPNALGGDTALENEQTRKDMDSALASLGADTDSWAYAGGKLGGEMLGTSGAGGVLARGAMAVPGVARVAPKLIESLRTAGMSTGAAPAATFAGKAADMGTRIVGGAASGAATSAAVGDDATFGAAIGGVLPPGIAALGGAGRAAFNAVTPEKQAMARKIAQMAGLSNEELRGAMNIQAPSMVGTKLTVPQILREPAISQLQRTVINASDRSPLVMREIEQNAQRLAAIDRIAPVAGSLNEAADVAGSAIENFARPARLAEGNRVTRIFESVDPFNESRITLPLDEMASVRDKLLGDGTFGTGESVEAALKEANRIGTYTLPAVDAMKTGAASKSQSLEQAVRAYGGLKGRTGEMRDLGIKESGTTGLINNKTGKSPDLVAEEMYRRGYLDEPDPDLMIEMLRNKGGRNVFANDQVEGADGMRRAYELAMEDAPGEEVLKKAIPWEKVQSLRSSLNDAWKDASSKGPTKESKALRGMIDEIDKSVDNLAAGNGVEGDYFAGDMVEQWRKGLKAHADKKKRFDTGPQAGMFRRGGDGQPAIQGAEIPSKFFSPKLSQIEDAEAFKRLVGDNEVLPGLLKSYATTEAAQQVTSPGVLSRNALQKWMKSREGAIKNTFNEQEVSTLNQILKDVQRADDAATLGMAAGSNTKQNFDAANRMLRSPMLDNPLTRLAFDRIPGVKNVSAPVLKWLQDQAAKSKAETLGGLLVDPDELSKQLGLLIQREKPGMFSRAMNSPTAGLLGGYAVRGAPLLQPE